PALEAVGPRRPLDRERVFLVCGRRRPQLKRDPLGGQTSNDRATPDDRSRRTEPPSVLDRCAAPCRWVARSSLCRAGHRRKLRGLQGPHLWFRAPRSEEHTSELQSRFDLVCRLLLEKKKKQKKIKTNENTTNYVFPLPESTTITP